MKRWFDSGVGIVLAYFSVGLVILLLQAFPYTGIFLMILAGPIWIGWLVHIALAHLAIASLTKTIARAWIVIPIAYYAAGYVLHMMSINQVNAQVAAIEKANAAATIKAERPFTFLSEGGHGAFELLEHYQTDRAFLRQGDGVVTTQFYARGETCDLANKTWNYNERTKPHLTRPDLFPRYKGDDKTRQCIISQDGQPAEWRYRIVGGYTSGGDFFHTRFGKKWTVFDQRTGAELLTVEVGGFKMLPAIQTVFAGCALNSGAARWDCGAALMRETSFIPVGYKQRTDGGNPFSPIDDPATWEISALGRALSLEPRKPTD